MPCPTCQRENPEATKFCGNCGTPLNNRCAKCGSENPPQFKFCGECGVPLVTAGGVAASTPTLSIWHWRGGVTNQCDQYSSTRIRGTTQRESRGKRRAASGRKRPYTVSADFGDGARDIVVTAPDGRGAFALAEAGQGCPAPGREGRGYRRL
jgi:hypothetical protein